MKVFCEDICVTGLRSCSGEINYQLHNNSERLIGLKGLKNVGVVIEYDLLYVNSTVPESFEEWAAVVSGKMES